jgi:hypothetical protein
MKRVTPLLRFMRQLDSEQKKEFANACSTTPTYLYQLAAQPRPNPTLRMALAAVAFSKQAASKNFGVDPLTLEDLLVGADDEHDVAAGNAGGTTA